MEQFFFTIKIISPVFLLIVLGIFLRKTNIVNEVFVSLTSKFVFTVSLPALIFLKLSSITIEEAFDGLLIITTLLLVLLIFIMSWIISTFLTKDPKDKGAFIQGSFRSNYAIVGLAIIANLIGYDNLGKASLLLAFVMPLYNILGVISLTVPMNTENKINLFQTTKDIILNPLILSVIIAIPFSIFQIEIGDTLNVTIGYLGEIALPLALIGIGASLNLERLKSASSLSIISSFLKIIIFPAIAVLVGVLLQFDKEEMLILFILFASPTAIASFIMAEAMNSNAKLSGDIIVVSTLCSVITISFGVALLKYFHLF